MRKKLLDIFCGFLKLVAVLAIIIGFFTFFIEARAHLIFSGSTPLITSEEELGEHLGELVQIGTELGRRAVSPYVYTRITGGQRRRTSTNWYLYSFRFDDTRVLFRSTGDDLRGEANLYGRVVLRADDSLIRNAAHRNPHFTRGEIFSPYAVVHVREPTGTRGIIISGGILLIGICAGGLLLLIERKQRTAPKGNLRGNKLT